MNKLRLISVVLIVLLWGCAIPPAATPPPKAFIATYEFTPPEQALVKEHDIAFVLITPNFAPLFEHSDAKIFTDFRDNMEKDFEELLIARGYTMRGPVETWDEITYQDKKETDMTLEAEIHIDVIPDASAIKSYYSFSYETTLYYLEGQVSVTGYVNLTLKEGFSREKLYIKKINMEPIQVTAKSNLKYYEPFIPATDVGINNALVHVMETAYKKLLQKAWDHLHPEEIKPLKAEVLKLREKRKY